MTISEKSAYLKGLAEGMKLDTDKAEGKLISELIELVSDIASTVEVLDSEAAVMADYVDELDHDLGELEEYVWDCEDEDEDDIDDDEFEYGEYDDDEDGECDGDCDGCCGCDEDGDVFDVEAEGMRCIMCESCGATIVYDETLDPTEVICPSCGKAVASKSDETEE